VFYLTLFFINIYDMKLNLLLFVVIFVAFFSFNINAQEYNTLNDKNAIERYTQNEVPSGDKVDNELQFLAFFITQSVTSNMYPESSLFNGQLVGRLFGQNSSTTSDTVTSRYVEQRLLPFFIYQPKLFNGKALLRASFEIDWTWGDQAYGLSGNKGAAISADQVNIQTQNVELELIPVKHLYINLGLQRLYDTPFNPYRTFFDKMTNTGYRLAYFGTDGAGISVRYDGDYNKIKTGYYKLYENLGEDEDDVTLFELMYRRKLSMKWNVGASLYYIKDNGKGLGGVSVFNQGLNSTLASYNGAFNFNMSSNQYRADIAWLGAFFSRNPDFFLDRLLLSGFINYNIGKVDLNENDTWSRRADIGGFAANFRAAYRFGQTTKDYFSIDFLYATGDGNGIDNNKYSGVITGNTWGMPASIFIGSGAYILFPSGNVVNRFTPVISDISNMGYGLYAGTANLYKDVVPNKLNVKIGTAVAFSAVKPQNGGMSMGNEYNAAMEYTFGPFMSISLIGAYVTLGDFFDSNDDSHGSDINSIYYDGRPVNPWTVMLVYKWLMF